MTALFRYDPVTVDQMLMHWYRVDRHAPDANIESAERDRGFSAEDLVGGPNGADLGPITGQLHCLVYWLFTNPKPIALAHGAFPKLVSITRAHLYPNSPGTAYVSVGVHDSSVLIAAPHVDDILVGRREGSFGQARAALHAAAGDLVERVNLVWPAVVTLRQQASS